MTIKSNKNIILALVSLFVGGLVGFLMVRRLLGSAREKRLRSEVASFDFYVDSPPLVEPRAKSSIQ